jgi:hypothetical protein
MKIRHIIFIVIILLCSKFSSGVKKGSKSSSGLKYKSKKQKLGPIFMIKSFWLSLFDPEYAASAMPSKVPGIKIGQVSGSLGGSTVSGSGGSFGPVCGPNGCS